MNKIAFIITTMNRPELLKKSLNSLFKVKEDNREIIVIDQSDKEIKPKFPVHYYKVKFNSGLSYCRNFGVKEAKNLKCEFCVLGSDSFLFNETLNKINNLPLNNYDLIGFELLGCKCGWEGKLNLIEGQSFELDFVDKSESKLFYDIDICRNFFIAKTDSLLDVKWNENLKLAEHEPFFHEYKKKGYKCGWTNMIIAEKMKDSSNEYKMLRQLNFNEGKEELKRIYGIKKWITYKNLDRAHRSP